MILQTPITPAPLQTASHQSSFMMLGSCFAQNVGEYLINNKFNTILNPFGILYNPASIAQNISRLLENRPFSTDELALHNGLYFSFAHHGCFSNSDVDVALENINRQYEQATNAMSSTDVFIITFGSSIVYQHNETDRVVANCHKLASRQFTERRLSIEEITSTYKSLINSIRNINPSAQFIFTVSPIRYLSYGAQQSQCNKATLLLACEEICASNTDTHYFPAYEIMMDELRDYRFYAADMIHPNEVAIEYIWEKFSHSLFTKETIKLLPEIDKINRAIAHKPLHPDTEEYAKFRSKLDERIELFSKKHNIKF